MLAEHEIGHDLLGLVGIGIVHLAARGRVEADYLGHGAFELILVDTQTRHYFIEMLVGLTITASASTTILHVALILLLLVK